MKLQQKYPIHYRQIDEYTGGVADFYAEKYSKHRQMKL